MQRNGLSMLKNNFFTDLLFITDSKVLTCKFIDPGGYSGTDVASSADHSKGGPVSLTTISDRKCTDHGPSDCQQSKRQ